MDIEVKHEFGGKVRTVLFNRPTKKNAITAAMYASLAEQLVEASASPAGARGVDHRCRGDFHCG